jgi:hypothetical protein
VRSLIFRRRSAIVMPGASAAEAKESVTTMVPFPVEILLRLATPNVPAQHLRDCHLGKQHAGKPSELKLLTEGVAASRGGGLDDGGKQPTHICGSHFDVLGQNIEVGQSHCLGDSFEPWFKFLETEDSEEARTEIGDSS